MWLFVFFDLPVVTKPERRAYSEFRKRLQKDGFTMVQFSVYASHCASRESAEVHINRVKKMLPTKGQVSILQITDQQYGNMINFWGKKSQPPPPPLAQLELF